MTKNQTDSEDDSDDYDIAAEANCELAMVEDQLCSIPYELYDLSDLTGILSIETWNSFLTEEERFFLSCFLPDMDHETFSLTMHQLLGGASLYLGNPVDKLYMKLRGGLFTPKVASYNEGVMLVKRKMYYYSLKLYHQKLIKTFTEIQRLWDHCGTQIRNLKLLDFNRVPSEGMVGATCSLTTASVVKKPMERNRTKSLASHRSASPKNTLKMKITKKGIFPYQGSSFVSSAHHPKGLLKVVPKSSSAILGKSYESPKNSLLQIHEIGSKSSRFAASPYLGTRFEKPYGTIGEFPKCLVNNQATSFTYLETTQSSIDKIEPVLYDPIPRVFGASNNSITEHNLPTKQEEYVHYRLKSPGCKPGMVETKEILSGKNFEREANVLRQPLHILSEDNHSRKTGDDHLFSLTYKRRKIQRIVGS
ncbi:hypothetical protein V5N11_021070 [Cardamine amara subsp. amara]|uniref:DEUBAD domain-containing protein n=1 Tax=Cardamine amara subsp. amara TaxID=228776 RepID=A0ABD1BSY6_CARAN